MEHPNHNGESISFPGVYIKPDFLTDAEAASMLTNLDSLRWELSQSGRRKQNYGPKCNFKKRRLRIGDFCGFPGSTKSIQDKLSEVPLLQNFQTVEQCSLEYDPSRGASIDPHIDDCWIWGERIVTVNILGDTVLTMTVYDGKSSRYNLEDVPSYPPVVKESNEGKPFDIVEFQNSQYKKDIVVRLPMPAKSLMVLYGEARYGWEHSVLREDINSRRVCLAYRELTPPYLPNGKNFSESVEILEKARMFW
ncbi:alpha-ketoglutarate-dependent dioxygenase alkB homolog 4 isoform X2 [Cephus cinctus]|nr:alpha-ketoglutarate-dependent dioxygenase alkB homolog 4 isoform X2 [Cephus cinctus]XP_015602026.1 alpha-ketoglutarate-dependent dioxygenase alkB homolog 4 isoform X2 [Cephus cinctus]